MIRRKMIGMAWHTKKNLRKVLEIDSISRKCPKDPHSGKISGTLEDGCV